MTRSLASRFAAHCLSGALAALRRPAAFALGVLGVGALVVSSVYPPGPWLVWNMSKSAPVGLYRIRDSRGLVLGDMVLARLPERFRRLAAQRRYLPANVPLIKRVAAVPGDRVCAIGASIFINGTFVAARAARDARGRPMPWWSGCVRLDINAYFLLMDSAASFDGRYFAMTRRADIIGVATPIWLR
jgi:conjugative transfer signal peptidase TraF